MIEILGMLIPFGIIIGMLWEKVRKLSKRIEILEQR